MKKSNQLKNYFHFLEKWPLYRVLIILVLFSFLYASPIKYMWHIWITKKDYNHCLLIPFISLYMIWERREELKNISIQPSWWGLIPFAFAIFLYFLVHQYLKIVHQNCFV